MAFDETQKRIEIRVGSKSDIPKIRAAYDLLDALGIPYSPRILSAHRTPDRMAAEAKTLKSRGYRACVTGAGGSAHLGGMSASETLVPVIALPVIGSQLDGIDSLLSMIQMPRGIPAGTVGIGDAESAAYVAAQIAYLDSPEVRNRIREKRGIAGTIDDIFLKPIVGVIVQGNTTQYNDVQSKMSEASMIDIGSGREKIINGEYHSPQSRDELVQTLRYFEGDGVSAIIAAGDVTAPHSAEFSDNFYGAIARETDIPVIALPLASRHVNGLDGNQYLVNMFDGKHPSNGNRCSPLVGVGINNMQNAVLYAAHIIGQYCESVDAKLGRYRTEMAAQVRKDDALLQEKGVQAFLS